jgi:hypothetical protein
VAHVKDRHALGALADNRACTVATEGTGYCINCGARLEAVHRFCWNCGAQRWTPENGTAPVEERPAPPTPGTPVFGRRPPAAARVDRATSLGLLPWLYASGAVLCLVEATQGLASLISPDGRAQLVTQLTQGGVPASMLSGLLAFYWVLTIGGMLVGAAVHGAAFYGLRRFRRWGWIAAVVVAALWSLLIVGIPVLVRLVSRDVRQAFGVD